MNVKASLDTFADYIKTARPSIAHATVDATEKYVRQVLSIKKKEPLVYRGLALTCRGSKKWRYEQSYKQAKQA